MSVLVSEHSRMYGQFIKISNSYVITRNLYVFTFWHTISDNLDLHHNLSKIARILFMSMAFFQDFLSSIIHFLKAQ